MSEIWTIRHAPHKTAYLAGPMRGIDDFNFPAFHAATAELRSRGWRVLSPAEHDEENGFDPGLNTLDGFSLTDAMRWDLQSVIDCDTVVLLPGYEGSTGVGIELTVARAIGREILTYPDMTPIEDEPVTLEAHRIVNGARQNVYGHPFHDFSRTARLWSGVLGTELTPEQVALMMVLVKISRLCNTPDHRDSVVDIAGYAETLQLVQQYRATL